MSSERSRKGRSLPDDPNSRGHVDDGRLKDLALAILDAEFRVRVVRSWVGRRAAVLVSPVYPSAAAGPGGCISVINAGNELWQVPGLEQVAGYPTWAADGSALAGYVRADAHVRPWVIWPDERRVVALNAATPDMEEPPIGWAGPDHLIVGLPSGRAAGDSASPRLEDPQTFEVAPFSRVRLQPLQPSVSLQRPFHLGLLDLRQEHDVAELPLPARVYVAVRASVDGCRIAALAADSAGGHELYLLAWTADGWVVESMVRVDGVPGGMACSDDGVVVATLDSDGGRLRIYPSPGGERVLRDDVLIGEEALSLPPWLPWVLATGEGDRLVMVSAGRARLSEWRMPPAKPPARAEVVDVECGGPRPQFAVAITTSSGNSRVAFLEAGPDSAVLRTRQHVSLGAQEEVVGVADWGRATALAADGSTVRTVAPERAGSRPSRADSRGQGPLSRVRCERLADPLDDSRADVTCLLPPDPQEGGLVVLQVVPSGVLAARPRQQTWEKRLLAAPVTRVLLGLGFPVILVDLDVPWWPELSDERIRPDVAERVDQLVASARDASGLDDCHLVVSGQSFGATLALIALADTDLFSAAAVTSGAYSRAWTLLGFQAERRVLWEAEQVYRDFDAVLTAPRIRRPVLILHGMDDVHPATPPTQAELLFQALTALGTPCRMVLLPGEGHVLATREGISAAAFEHAMWVRRWTS